MAVLKLSVLLGIALASASYAQERTTNEGSPINVAFESDQVRARGVRLAAGQRIELQNHPDALLIPFTADLEGRIPREEATWHEAGTTTLVNNASATTFNGIFVELTAPASDTPASLPPEVFASRIPRYSFVYRVEGHRVSTVLENERVLVTKHRLPAWQPQTEPIHWHPREVVLVYLVGGQIKGSTGHLWTRRVGRGDFDVLPAQMPHAFDNAGNDPIEFLMITPK